MANDIPTVGAFCVTPSAGIKDPGWLKPGCVTDCTIGTDDTTGAAVGCIGCMYEPGCVTDCTTGADDTKGAAIGCIDCMLKDAMGSIAGTNDAGRLTPVATDCAIGAATGCTIDCTIGAAIGWADCIIGDAIG